MSKRKTFDAGQQVEIRRASWSRRDAWEPATYRRPVPDMRGWHHVELAPGAPLRRINPMSGEEWIGSSEPPANYYGTSRVIVPTQRVRAKEAAR